MDIISVILWKFPSHFEYESNKHGWKLYAEIKRELDNVCISIVFDDRWYYYTVSYGQSFVINRTADPSVIEKSINEYLTKGVA